jgi:DNA-binding SARP family transcriptional activator
MTLLSDRGPSPNQKTVQMAVEFRLLGDVEARIGGHAVDIGHARQRCVLAALLIEPNRPVSAEILLDHAWADRRPHHSRNALSGYVSRLRHTFTAAEQVRIARQPGGYVIAVEPMAVDLHRFRYLIGRARQTESAPEANTLYEQALRLWRGDAFTNLDTPWINALRESLAAERLAAELDHIDIRLRLRHHTELVSELSARVAAHPFDERLASQYVLALYRCGRQADALTHYEHLRRGLADTLGIDPSPPSQKLHHQILVADPALSIPTTGPPAPSDRARSGTPTGSRSLAELDASLADERMVLVTGEAGTGKSTLVQQFVERHQSYVRFLVGLCDPVTPPLTLAPLRDIAGQVGGPLAARLAAGATREEIFAAFLDELATHHGPQVVVVEDAHWADKSTVDLLVVLGRRLNRLHATLVVTYRDDELGRDHPLRIPLDGVPRSQLVHVRLG